MKLSSTHLVRVLVTAFASIVFLLAGPATSWADDHDKKQKKKHDSRDWDRRDDDRRVYYSRPRSSFALSFGSGYAGPGYYYGPAGAPYYYEAPGVAYYRTRTVVPSRYFVREESYQATSTDAAVQRALARRGYYRGPIDGDIGPMSSRAIARFQADRGLRVTGTISSSLLRELGLY